MGDVKNTKTRVAWSLKKERASLVIENFEEAMEHLGSKDVISSAAFLVCGQAFVLKVHPSTYSPSELMVFLENNGSPVRVNGLQVTVGSDVRKEKNIELGHMWEDVFNNELNDEGDLEVVVEWTMVETRKDFSVESSKVEHRAVKTPSLKSWVLESIFKDGMEDTDFTLVCNDGVEVPVHKVVMKGTSEYFKAMMKPEHVEGQEGVSNIDCGSEVGHGLVSFVYTGVVDASTLDKNLVEFLKVADQYDMVHLKEKVEERMLSKLNVSNMMEYVIAGNSYNAKRLKTMSQTLLRANLGELRKDNDWKKAFASQKDLLIEILDME